ncbi:MAG: nicotinate-nucleotide--dimethylbenzimidazole phosphoribosyltransferase [Clostridiales bacterium]|uniref:nicotinate-nucleotide--dimethylbenzimidazole phosphoribosyltransferase n=1 Tax=Clostridium sp. N3C TaxID=1776758 RepID=UPI00092E12C1|nr:nicotinate-nucleotide--dimethylbenzimidazole phosphoribosyltransferase [Clostridium sp. N3C]NLZ50019.1 nicotinate-nucleotide--dimethylbenzimidazole phosphoribosyltransferase [Clostridiales bacterium]SCN26224.1 Nicotinate-nucleotide-dimethylbenzimidazolephosphoribosyltransferase [Clostridium sp. N3C]
MDLLRETLSKITESDKKVKEEVRRKWDGLLKPIGSLGALEEIIIKICGMTGKIVNKFDKKAIAVMCSDNGVVDEGVSSAPQIFTKILAESMQKGLTGVATLGKYTGTDILTVDLGIKGKVDNPQVIDRKIADGTKNFTKGPAMTYEEAVKSIEIGIEVADEIFSKGYDILGTGEVGIGNTSTAVAVLSSLSSLEVDLICGKGVGLTEEQHSLKKEIIKKAIAINKPNKDNPIDVISKVGGFDIGGMCGLCLSAAKNKKPVVIDGFISSVAALCATKLNPYVKEYIIPSHLSAEPGAKYVFDELGLKPILNLEMRLGEGSGCPLTFKIIETAEYLFENMGTHDDVSMSTSYLIDIREG